MITMYVFPFLKGVEELNKDFKVGEPTLQLILDAFLKPCGYDIRGTCIFKYISNNDFTASSWFVSQIRFIERYTSTYQTNTD